MGERDGNRSTVQEVRTHRDRVGTAREYEEALMTVGYIETLVTCVVLSSVIVSGVMYGIGRLIVYLIEHKGDVG